MKQLGFFRWKERFASQLASQFAPRTAVRTRARIGTAIVLMAATFAPAFAQAQRVLGAGDDATVLPSGVFRLRIAPVWTSADGQYDRNGDIQPAGSNLSFDSIGTNQFPALTPLQNTLRTLSGQSALNISLGRTIVRANNRVTVTPITAELGLFKRLSIDVTVPIVKTHASIFFQANPAGDEGNVGVNGFADADTAFAGQMIRAANAVAAYCAGTGAGTTECTSNPTLAADALAFGNGLATVYGSSALIPRAGSDVQLAIDTRSATLRAALNQFAAITSTVPTITETGVTGAARTIATGDFNTILELPAFAVQSAPLATIDRFSVGDIELGAKVMVFDPYGGDADKRNNTAGFKTRLAIGGMLRLPTGKAPSSDNFVDIGTGTHQWALGVRGYTDIMAGRHFWTSLVVRYDFQIANDQIMRVAAPKNPFAAIYLRQNVHRQLGNLLELEATPRWSFNDFFAISGFYVFRHKPVDRYTGSVFSVGPDSLTGGNVITANPALLGQNTELREHRIGGGIAFSNIAAYNAGKAKIPFEVSFQHFQTISGKGGNVPRVFGDRIQIRLYHRIFGN